MGKRIDVVLITGGVIFVIEFKVGEKSFLSSARDQVWDYALDLKNFHEPSHCASIVPILLATGAIQYNPIISTTPQIDGMFFPIESTIHALSTIINNVITFCDGQEIDAKAWEIGRYCPTPTIIEAAIALYNGHAVEEISRNDAHAINLSSTSETVLDIIKSSQSNNCKSICFVTGVPGAGKTLVGLNVATQYLDQNKKQYSVFLSGNGPLVAILREALVRNNVLRGKDQGKKIKKGEALHGVKAFIQNVHHFRDSCLTDPLHPPIEHVALFDEAQRAWDLKQTARFMVQKKGQTEFGMSEPEFLISCLDRHKDWAVVVCLVGGGQEINTGEAGISEWIQSIVRSYPEWHIYISPRLIDTEYGAGNALELIKRRTNVTYKDELHLSVSMRSFRAENVSLFVKQTLDLHLAEAQKTLALLNEKYPVVITRNLKNAKEWLRKRARGTERYGIVVSSQAQRLKPHAIDVKSPIDPIHWFLDDKEDVRSSYYMEDVATEFHVQGLELDWVCVTWDADFRYSSEGWKHWSFCGDRWNRIKKQERQIYLKNAYRVLLTRARQGMVIVIPEGDSDDKTRAPEFYDPTFNYLKSIGFEII
jgi:hypothetical protein